MKIKINKIIIVSYLLFALSFMILYLNRVVAFLVLAASFLTFILGGIFHALSDKDSQIKTMKKKKGRM
jgi:hypothetical protein